MTMIGLIGMIGTTAMAANISMVGTAESYNAYKLINLDVTLKTKDVWVCNCGEIIDADKHDEHAKNHLLKGEDTNGYDKQQPICGHEDDQHTRDCYTFQYTVNEKYKDVLKQTAEDLNLEWDTDQDTTLSDEEIVKGLGAMDAATSEAYASKIYEAVKDFNPDAEANEDTKHVFMNVDQGYYLLAGDDTIALLNTDGDNFFTIMAKETIPNITSKILIPDESQESGFRQADALDIRKDEVVTLEVTVTMPTNVASYKNYGFTIHNESVGLELAEPETIYVNGEEAKLTGGMTVKNDTCSFHTPINQEQAILTVNDEPVVFDKDTIVTVHYPVRLSHNFVTDYTGNTNETWIEFTNNPIEADSVDNTVRDKIALFTYKGIANSVSSTNEPLTGAEFTLYRQDNDTWTEITKKSDAELTTSFVFEALDAGIYKLVETKVPDGYVKADDVIFELRAEYEQETENPVMKRLAVYIDGKDVSTGDSALFSVNMDNGTISTNIVSTKATTPEVPDEGEDVGKLPSTGETGRYIILFGGCALMLFGFVSFLRAGKKN